MFVCAECGASQPGPGPCRADGSPMMPIGDDLLLGTTIGAYRVARLLGVGGMGRVYKGVHPTIGSRVAIKVLSRECSDRRDLVDRFFSEAKAVNLIRHESIVNVLDLATLPDGRPYIVMEYLDGSPLAGIIEHAQRSGMPIPLGGLARLVAEVLDALGAAHAKGIIHRDLKPDNIYVTPAGRAKVLDFGIAKLMQPVGEAASGSATHTGSLLGTPHYMSPEQAAGRPVDARADLYAIGVILFECSTLQKPFIADSLFDLLRKHVEAPPPSPRALRRDMPEGLEHVIYTALAKLPEQRFASAHAMSMALQHATMTLPSEQWAPIQPASSSRNAPSGGWNPTPPASWAGGNRPSVATAPTHTAGQVTRRDRGGSKKGLWLALGALVLVGGGITAAVIAGGGKDNKQVVAQGSGSEAGSAGSASGSDAWGTSGSGARDVVTPPVTPPAEHETPDPDDDADDGDLDAASTEAMDQAFAEAFNNLDPAARAMFPPELNAALKKYGKWSKIPKAERMKLLAKISGMTANLTKSRNDINRALAGDAPGSTAPTPPSAPPTTKTPNTSVAPVAGLDANGWVVSRRFNPSGYNKKNLSVEKYLPTAVAEAKKLVPDAVLFRIDADGVFPDGHADLTLAEHGSLDFRFISPKRAKGDPKLPLGAKQEYKCMFRVQFDEQGAWSAPIDGWECKETLIGPPKCTTAQVWKKAIAKGAPANAIAQLGYRAWDGKARWYFDIDGTKFSEVFDDDCR